MKIKKEPVAILSAVTLLVGALTAIGIIPVGIGGGLVSFLMLVGGPVVRKTVTPMLNIREQVARTSTEKVAEAALETAWSLDDLKTGPSGTVTEDGRKTAAEVVQRVTGTDRATASDLVSSILGQKRRRS
jgi:hypothetical protein